MMDHDAARLCTVQRRALSCRAITHSKQQHTIYFNCLLLLNVLKKVIKDEVY